MDATGQLTLRTKLDAMALDDRTGRLISFRSHIAPDQEFIAHRDSHPAFVLGFLDEKRHYRFLDSSQAEDITVEASEADGRHTITAGYRRLAGMDLEVITTVSASEKEEESRWSITVCNDAGMCIVDVHYPFVVCPFELGGTPHAEAVLLPHGYGPGRLLKNFGDTVRDGWWRPKLSPDTWQVWEHSAVNGKDAHYPGLQFAQFLAYYNDRAGIYLACNDIAGRFKRFAPVLRDPGFRLGVSHVGDWPANGERRLEYEVILRSFSGDWYDAADIYREWALAQKWAVPLTRRKDVPAWLIDSPVYVTIRPQGVVDAGPIFPVEEFLPYEKCIPLLEHVEKQVDAPVVAVFMGWEREGSWIYPESLPFVGGEESLRRFCREARKRGWHVGTFCNGTRWVVGHYWNGYDGRRYFDAQDGASCVSQEADGSMWMDNWDRTWRPSYSCCIGTEKTRRMSVEYVRKLIDLGLESIQFFDQNNGAATPPCFAGDHDHPPGPGRWMTDRMERLVTTFRDAAHQAGETGVIHSAESGINEYCLQQFQEAEIRLFPPGYGSDTIPLYQYLYHECVVFQGMMGNAPEPYHMQLRTAVNCVYGQISGGVLTGDGTFLNKDTMNWAPWEKSGSDADSFRMLRAVTALRRGPARDFLVFGRMLRPAEVEGIEVVTWSHESRANAVPAVFHTAWRAPDGSLGVVLANWTGAQCDVTVRDTRLVEANDLAELVVFTSAQNVTSKRAIPTDAGVVLSLPALSAVLLEGRSS